MKLIQKQNIIKVARLYMQEHALSQSDVARATSINQAYLIEMFKNNDTLPNGTVISDKYYRRLAEYANYSFEKSYWEKRDTPQLKVIVSAIMEAKKTGSPAVLVGETGCGKTYTCKLIQRRFPKEVFIVTVGASDNLGDLLDKVLEAMKVKEIKRTKSARIRAIIRELQKMNEAGIEPVLIFDEAEYMKIPALATFKELYDALNDLCALILIGTKQLTDNLDKLRRRDKPGIPQLYRRIKYRIKHLPPVDKRYSLFLKDVDKDVAKWLQKTCDNYGELHDVLVPALREADRTEQKLTIDFIEMVIGI